VGSGSGLQYIKISPDGSKLICIYAFFAELCDFNTETGIITPLFTFINPTIGSIMDGQVEFSLDSKFLYSINQVNSSVGEILQWDLSFTDSSLFVQSATPVGLTTANVGFQRSPDNRIYVTVHQADSIDVINHPEIQGPACDFQRHVLGLNGNLSYSGFPQFLQRYYLYMNHTGRCLNDSIMFSFTVWPPADSSFWIFGDPGSGASNTSLLPSPSHLFSVPGEYTVTVIVRHNDKRSDTAVQVIHIEDSPQPDLGPDQSICQGDSTLLDAGPCSGCTFQWDNLTFGLFNIGNEQTLYTHDSGLYQVTVTNSYGCFGKDTAHLSVNVPPVVTNSPLSKSICSGESINIPLTSTIPGTSFSWTAIGSSLFVTGYSSDSGDTIDQTLTVSGPGPDTVTYTITPAAGGCAGDSVSYVVTVTPGDSVLVSIAASADTVCEGIQVTFTASSTNGGSNPAYQWKVNANNVGMNNAVFTYMPANGDLVKCIMTSSITNCISNNPAISNTIAMVVNPNLPVSVSVSPSVNPVCAGTTVTFTANPLNPGTSPIYLWKVNGLTVGTNSPIFSYIPANNDVVTCTFTSSENCTSGNPATSAPVFMTVNQLLPVSVNISASSNPFCISSSVIFTALPTNQGSSPVYQWKVNGANAGTNSPAFSYNPFNNDSVRCIMTSNLACVSGNPTSSNTISMSGTLAPVVTFKACFDTITSVNAKPIKLKGGVPLKGTYFGPGVSSGIFNPAAAGIGTKIITYTYTNAGLCSASKTKTIVVQSAPVFVCGNTLTDIRDGKTYPTIQLDSQCWLAANLNYGNEIPANVPQRDNCIPEKYSRPSSLVPRPSFYQWDELMRYEESEGLQGLCPPGWHVPSESDWQTLFANWTNNAFAGAPLKYAGYSGFNALLFGTGFFNRGWYFNDFATFFWSSTPHGPWKAWSHAMNDYDFSVSYYPSYRANAFSVRCVRD